LPWHWCCNCHQLHLLCETQICVVTGGKTAFNFTYCAKHRIALSLVEQRLSFIICVRSTELRCHCWSNGFQIHFLCETQNFVVTRGATVFNYTWSGKHRFALLLVLQRLSITLVVRSTELRFHWWSNGFQLQLLCETQNYVVAGVTTAFNFTCAKHRIALSLVEQPLSIKLVRIKVLGCHWWRNGFQLHLFCETQNCLVSGGPTAFNNTSCAKHRIALSLVEQSISITHVRNTELRCHWYSNGFQLHFCEAQNCVVTGGVTAFNNTCSAKNRFALPLVEQRLSITIERKFISFSLVLQQLSIKLVRSTELRCICGATAFNYTCVRNTELLCHWWCNGFQLHLCQIQKSVVTGGTTAYNCTCCRSTKLCCQWWNKGFQLHLLSEAQNCVITGGATAFNYTCAMHRIAYSLVV